MGNMTTLQILQGVHDWVLDKIDEETANFITKTVNDLVNYYTKSETYTKAEVQQIVDAIKQFTYEVVQVLPTASASTMNKIYLVPAPKSEDKNIKEEYITIQDGSTYSWEMLGTTSIDLSNYYTKGQTDSAISSALSSALASYTTTADLTTLLAQKQDVIQDLADIRSGASAGSTAVQPSTLNNAVKNVVAESGVYDVSANNDNTKFESLSALLSSADLNTLIPTDIRKGGMSIKFVLSSDNKYVQYRLMSSEWSTTLSDWQGVDDEPTVGSNNLVKSGGVYEKVSQLVQETGKIDNQSLSTIISAPAYGIYSDISSIPIGTEVLVRYFIGVQRGYSVSICSEQSVETKIRTIVPQKQHSIGTYYATFRKENSNENYLRIVDETSVGYRPSSVVIYNNNYSGIHSGWLNAEGKSSLMPPDDHACHLVFPVESGQEIKVKSRTLSGCVFAFLASYTPPSANGQSYDMIGERVVVTVNAQEVATVVPSGANFIWVSVSSVSGVSSYYPQYVKIDGYDIIGSLLDNIRDNIKITEELKQKVDPIEADKLVKSVVNPWDNYDAAIQDTNGNILAIFSNGHIKTKNFDSSNIVVQNMVIHKAVFMGDSITHGVYSYWHNNEHVETARYNGFDITNLNSVEQATAYHGIHYYFGLIAQCNNVINLGKRGTGYVADTRNIGNALVVATNYDFSDVDFVALCFGVNDYIQGKAIGDILTKESGTIIGNMCATIEKILTDNPLCKVVVYSPYNTWGQVSYGGDYVSNTLYGDEATNYALGHTINGNTLQDIINAEDEVCMHYGVQHVKLSKSNVVNRFTIKNIMIDGLHPSKDAYIKLAAEIYGKGNFGD